LIRPPRSVPVPFDVGIAVWVRVPASGLGWARWSGWAGASGLLCPGATVPVALARRWIVRIRIPTGLPTFDHANYSLDRLVPPIVVRNFPTARGSLGVECFAQIFFLFV
jgi:hypothetical protein